MKLESFLIDRQLGGSSLEFFPSAQAAAEDQRTPGRGNEDEAVFVIYPYDSLVHI